MAVNKSGLVCHRSPAPAMMLALWRHASSRVNQAVNPASQHRGQNADHSPRQLWSRHSHRWQRATAQSRPRS
eukprot:4267870-Prymnesium_polylepis.1